jgi:hypothetical protein
MKSNDLDLEGNGDGYSGTFRWKRTKKLKSMPSWNKSRKLNITGGWMEYLISRGSTEDDSITLIGQAQQDLSLIDCLSTPVTIAKMCLSAGICTQDSTSDCLHIICIGTSDKAEGRVLNETNCFSELSHIFPNIRSLNLYLVGPEMSETITTPQRIGSNLDAYTYRGTSIDFFRANPSMIGNTQAVVVGLNCGFGNWENPMPNRYSLLFQWLKDLYFITATKLPLLFTCANDYADLVGEVSVMQNIMGAYFIHSPR